MFSVALVLAAFVGLSQCDTPLEAATHVFTDLDVNKDNHLSESDLVDYLKKVDPDGDGSMNLAQYAKVLTGLPKNEIITRFHMYDKNKDGLLDSKDVHGVFVGLDQNSDGSVSLTEFANTWTKVLLPPHNSVPVGK